MAESVVCLSELVEWGLMRIIACVAAASMALPVAAGVPLYKTRDCSRLAVQMELNACAGANAQAADAALNALYRQLLRQTPDAGSARLLKDSERAWIRYRDRECAQEVGSQQDGGSIWPMEMSNCLEDKTAARLRELKRRLDCPQGPAACAR